MSADYPASGYIPGAGSVVSRPAALRAWREKNRDGIDQVQAKIEAIKSGQSKSGCIGEDKLSCAASIAAVVTVADDYSSYGASLFPDRRPDVNGHDLNEGRVKLTAYDPAAITGQRHLSFDLRIDRGGKVRGIMISLPKDPMFAKTQDEYDKTMIYEAVAPVVSLGKCPDLSRESVAQWFENKAKPKATFSPRKFESSVGNITESQTRSATGVPFCGRSFDISSIQGIDPQLVSLDFNPAGRFGGGIVEVH